MSGASIYMDAVAEVAGIAGDIAMEYYGSNPATRIKSDGSPVSVADTSAEQAAREWIELRFPEDGIVGEELPTVREGAARRWIIDPIDGTYTFLQSVPLWGTLIAVAEGDTVIAGAAYFPALDETIVAARGEGCWWNGSRSAVSTVAELAQARLVTTDARFLRVFFICVVMHMVWNSPLELPIYGKNIILGVVAWILVLGMIQAGLREVRTAQAANPSGVRPAA